MTSVLRCSSLPRAFLCPGSVHDDGGVLVEQHFDAADDGTDCHRLMAAWPDGDAPEPIVAELTEDARIGYYTAAKMWREEISAWMPNSQAEVEIVRGGLSGHVDRLAFNGATIAVLDYKFGRKDSSYKHQGFGYARLAFALADSRGIHVDTATVHFAWVREKALESYTVSRERAEEWDRERAASIDNWDGVYHTGDHCTGCRRQATCPALRALAKRDVEALSGPSMPDVTAMSSAEVVDYHRRLKVLQSLIDTATASVRREVETRGEVLDGAGNVLHLVEENGKREVDALKAWPVLQSVLDDEEIAKCVTVRIAEAEKLVAAKAGRGQGAKAKRELTAALDKAGAVTQATVTKLKMERKE